MKPHKLHKQSGAALIGVMALIVLSMVILPQIMNTSSFVTGRAVGQATQIKNTAKAEQVNHLMHASIATPPTGISLTDNFAKHFSGAISAASCESDPCLKRLSAADVNLCTSSRYRKELEPAGGKTVTVFACRNGTTASCGEANNANTTEMRLYACVYDQGSSGGNMSISVWSYLNLADRYLKVQEDSF